MVAIPPLAPSAKWWGNYLRALSDGIGKEEAMNMANKSLGSAKEFGRSYIQDSSGAPVMLSVAVEGGNRQLRDLIQLQDLKLSEHGDWRKNHLGALEACLGRKPFFRDLEPEIRRIYLNREERNLRDFNAAITETLYSFLMGNIYPDDLQGYFVNETLKDRGKEITEFINPEISLLQALADHGPETLLGVLAI